MPSSLTSQSQLQIERFIEKRRPLPLAIVFGAVLGLTVLFSWDLLTSKWAFYICFGFIAAGAIPIAARLAGGMERFLLILFVFSLQFYLSFNIIHEDTALPGGVQGINVSLQLLLIAAYGVVWLFNRHARRTGEWIAHRPFVKACAFFLATSALSFITTADHSLTTFGFLNNIAMVSIALVAGHMFATRKGLTTLSNVMLTVLVTQSIVFLIQRATHSVFTMEGEVLESNWGERVGGTLGVAPANVATLFAICLFFAEQRFFSKSRRTNPLVIAAFAIGFLCLLLSLTRSVWIGFGIGSAFLAADALRRKAVRPSTVAILGACLAVTLVIAYRPVRSRLDSNHHAAAEERWRLNYIGYEMIKAHPLTGVGINTAYSLKRSYIPAFFTEDDWVYIPHNQYIIIAAETGLMGFAGFVAVLFAALRAAWRARRARHVIVRDTATILFVSICAMMWCMTLDFYAGMQLYIILWFVLGAASGVAELAAREVETPDECLPASGI